MAAKQKFKGTLRPLGTGLQWTVITVPFDPAKVWRRRQRLRVRGTINGFGFRTSLFKTSEGATILLVNKKMQKEAGIRQGHVAEVLLEPDLEERGLAASPELDKVLRQDRTLRKWHEQLTDGMRKYIADMIEQPKSADARRRRAELWAERMMLTMEGEQLTPPILELAFQRQPRAREGWRLMTPLQRRSHLMGIFYYQSPESRQKRAQKTVEEAMRIAEKKAGRK